VPVQKRMSLAPLVAARAACRERPRWTAIFTKAYSLLAQEFPELRRAYVKIPWPHLYEYPVSKRQSSSSATTSASGLCGHSRSRIPRASHCGI
jgi:hypothetical protein